jgi:hypothetical protein
MTIDDRPTFADSYARAAHSGNLRQVENRISDPDRLIALAVTDRRLGSPLYRSRAANDASKVRELRALWRNDLLTVARNRHWHVRLPVIVESPDQIEVCDVAMPTRFVWLVADTSIMSWLLDVCPSCCGRRFELLDESAGRGVLTDRPCKSCAGTSFAKPVINPAFLQSFLEDSIEILKRRYERIGAKARTKLK